MRLSLKALTVGLILCSCVELKGETKHYLFNADAISFQDGHFCLKRYRLDSCRAPIVKLRRLRANKFGMYWKHIDKVDQLEKKAICLKETGLEK